MFLLKTIMLLVILMTLIVETNSSVINKNDLLSDLNPAVENAAVSKYSLNSKITPEMLAVVKPRSVNLRRRKPRKLFGFIGDIIGAIFGGSSCSSCSCMSCSSGSSSRRRSSGSYSSSSKSSGSSCSSSSQCSSSVCKSTCCGTKGQSEGTSTCNSDGSASACDAGYYLNNNECYLALQDGDACSSNSVCESNSCKTRCCNTNSDSTDIHVLQCDSYGDSKSCSTGYFPFSTRCLRKLSTGQTCSSNSQCLSSSCKGMKCCGETGTTNGEPHQYNPTTSVLDYGDSRLCSTCSSNSNGGCDTCISGYFGIPLNSSGLDTADDIEVSDPSVSLTTRPFSVSTGDPCTIDSAGCVLSKNYPSKYGNNERCTITVAERYYNGDGGEWQLSVVGFNTESGYDKLKVNGKYYDGSQGPNDVTVSAGDVLNWNSDGSATTSGFKICVQKAEIIIPIPLSFAVTADDPCTIDSAGCLLSKNYPSNYGNNEHCAIRVTGDDGSGQLNVVAFDTESGYDTLKVNGKNYAGSQGPNDVTVSAGDVLDWNSDGSSTRSGFKICIVKTTQNMVAYKSSSPAYMCQKTKVCNSSEYEESEPSRFVDRVCSVKQCICPNGIGHNGTECLEHGSIHCHACNNGFYRTDDDQCSLKRCECTNGNGATGSECPTHGGYHCEQCHTGYHSVASATIRGTVSCLPNICNCPEGVAVTGAKCLEDLSTTCSSCFNPSTHYFIASSQLCKAKKQCHSIGIEYEFDEGTATADRRCKPVQKCPKGEVELTAATATKDRTCENIQCTCSFGIGATFQQGCDTHNQQMCISCEKNYYLNHHAICVAIDTCRESEYEYRPPSLISNRDCRKKHCKCTNGTAAKGFRCIRHDKHICISCDENYEMGGTDMMNVLDPRCYLPENHPTGIYDGFVWYETTVEKVEKARDVLEIVIHDKLVQDINDLVINNVEITIRDGLYHSDVKKEKENENEDGPLRRQLSNAVTVTFLATGFGSKRTSEFAATGFSSAIRDGSFLKELQENNPKLFSGIALVNNTIQPGNEGDSEKIFDQKEGKDTNDSDNESESIDSSTIVQEDSNEDTITVQDGANKNSNGISICLLVVLISVCICFIVSSLCYYFKYMCCSTGKVHTEPVTGVCVSRFQYQRERDQEWLERLQHKRNNFVPQIPYK